MGLGWLISSAPELQIQVQTGTKVPQIKKYCRGKKRIFPISYTLLHCCNPFWLWTETRHWKDSSLGGFCFLSFRAVLVCMVVVHCCPSSLFPFSFQYFVSLGCSFLNYGLGRLFFYSPLFVLVFWTFPGWLPVRLTADQNPSSPFKQSLCFCSWLLSSFYCRWMFFIILVLVVFVFVFFFSPVLSDWFGFISVSWDDCLCLFHSWMPKATDFDTSPLLYLTKGCHISHSGLCTMPSHWILAFLYLRFLFVFVCLCYPCALNKIQLPWMFLQFYGPLSLPADTSPSLQFLLEICVSFHQKVFSS